MDVLKTLEVPMDGNMYYFPKADGTEVYTKQWLPNGTTRILTFKPSLDDKVDENTLDEEKLNVEQFNKVVEGILNEIQTINSKIDKISKSSTTTRSKKEVSEDE
jgi:transcription termination factor NusB